MKKLFKSYFAIWAVLLVLFNIIAFVSTGWTGQKNIPVRSGLVMFPLPLPFLVSWLAQITP